MAFEQLGRLEDQLDELQAKSTATGDSALRERIVDFAKAVYREMDIAFEGVDELLAMIVNTRTNQLNEVFVSGLLEKIDYSHSSKKFKIVLEVCARLDELAKTYKSDIDSVLKVSTDSYSELFWLLEKHEGLFRRTIENAVSDIAQALREYEGGDDIAKAKNLAASARTELQAHLARVRQARIALSARSGGFQELLNDDARADNILKNSAWFNGSFYLAAAVVLICTLSFFAGGLAIYKFAFVVAGSYVGVTLIGALQLRNDNKLSERGFLELTRLALVRVLLPVTRSARENSAHPKD